MQISKTENYELFVVLGKNRKIKESHVENLASAIKKNNFLNLYPIIVMNITVEGENKLAILDGQHRYQAAKKLKYQIHYLISESMTMKNVPKVNSVNEKWFLSDYLNYYAEEGKLPYIQFQQFIDKYGFKVSESIKMTSRTFGSTNSYAAFREGEFILKDLEFAENVAENLIDFRKYIDFYKHNHFVRALIIITRREDYDHKRMLEKLDFCSTKLHRCPDTLSYLRNLEELYNFKSQRNNLVYFSDEFRGQKYI